MLNYEGTPREEYFAALMNSLHELEVILDGINFPNMTNLLIEIDNASKQADSHQDTVRLKKFDQLTSDLLEEQQFLELTKRAIHKINHLISAVKSENIAHLKSVLDI